MAYLWEVENDSQSKGRNALISIRRNMLSFGIIMINNHSYAKQLICQIINACLQDFLAKLSVTLSSKI